jgi:hypothetical protein
MTKLFLNHIMLYGIVHSVKLMDSKNLIQIVYQMVDIVLQVFFIIRDLNIIKLSINY